MYKMAVDGALKAALGSFSAPHIRLPGGRQEMIVLCPRIRNETR